MTIRNLRPDLLRTVPPIVRSSATTISPTPSPHTSTHSTPLTFANASSLSPHSAHKPHILTTSLSPPAASGIPTIPPKNIAEQYNYGMSNHKHSHTLLHRRYHLVPCFANTTSSCDYTQHSHFISYCLYQHSHFISYQHFHLIMPCLTKRV